MASISRTRPPISRDLTHNERSRVSVRAPRVKHSLDPTNPIAGREWTTRRIATLQRRTSTSQNNELISSSLAPPSFFLGFPAVERGADFSDVLRLFGIGIAGGAPSSSPEFSCFIPGEAARVAVAGTSVSTFVAIERERV